MSGSDGMADGQPQYSYLIVGAGVFGVSTAYHLIKKFPDASVTIVDRDAYDAETRVAASWDWNKVVRADYDDIVYCKLALEAQDIFESDPLWKPYFHKTGIYWMCRSDYAQDVIDNYKKLGRSADLKAVPVEEARKLYGGLFEDADYTGVKEVLVNKTSGWVAAGDVLRAVTRECIRLGVRYIPADVASLQFDDEGHCSGVKTVLGNIISASHTIVCAGAFTPKLLEWSAQSSGNKDLRAGSRIVAGGITTGMTKLGDKDYARFKDMPVGVQGYNAKIGPFIGSLPPTPDDHELKWCSPLSTNAVINKHSTHLLLRTTLAATSVQPTTNPRPTTQLLSQRATLRSSAISNASAYFCQPHSLPAINHPQHTFDDYYSRHRSQCLPPASLLAPALPRPGLCHLFPNENLALAIAQTAKPCSSRTLTHAHTTQPRLWLLLSTTSPLYS